MEMRDPKLTDSVLAANDGSSFSRLAGLAMSLDATVITDAEGKVLFWNEAAEALFGPRAAKALGKDVCILLPPQLQDLYADILRRLDRQGRWEGMVEIVRADGACARILSRFIREVEPSEGEPGYAQAGPARQARQTGQAARIVSLHTDLTKAQRQDHAAALDWNLKATFARLFGQHPDGVFALSRDGTLLAANAALSTMTGYSHAALLSIPLVDLISPQDHDALRTAFSEACKGAPQSSEFSLVLRDGTILDASLSLLPNVVDSDIIGVHGIVCDISQRSADRRRILYLANHDFLTGLPNRNLLYDRMQLAFDRARRGTFCIGLRWCDGIIRKKGSSIQKASSRWRKKPA